MFEAFPPLSGKSPSTLILGTFPSPLSRSRFEYYGNPKNQFWHIIFDVFCVPFENPTYAEKADVLAKNGLALWDTLVRCEVEGALDSSIKNPVYNTSIPAFVTKNGISRVLFNGGNAYKFYKRGIGKIEPLILPSTSPANARLRYSEKLELWRTALLT